MATCAICVNRPADRRTEIDGRMYDACASCAGVDSTQPRRARPRQVSYAPRACSARVAAFVHAQASTTTAEVANAIGLSINAASSILCRLVAEGYAVATGNRNARVYSKGPRPLGDGRWYSARGSRSVAA